MSLGHPEIPALPHSLTAAALSHGPCRWFLVISARDQRRAPSGLFSDPWQRRPFQVCLPRHLLPVGVCRVSLGHQSPRGLVWASQCVTYPNPTVASPLLSPSWRPPFLFWVPFYAARGDPAHISASVLPNIPRKTPPHWAHNVWGVPGSQVPRAGSRSVQTLGSSPPLGRAWRGSPRVGWGHADDTRLRGDRAALS